MKDMGKIFGTVIFILDNAKIDVSSANSFTLLFNPFDMLCEENNIKYHISVQHLISMLFSFGIVSSHSTFLSKYLAVWADDYDVRFKFTRTKK